ncbi:MAG: hypothetical protein AB7I50_16610 [Vicinamibacterales bacterium]
MAQSAPSEPASTRVEPFADRLLDIVVEVGPLEIRAWERDRLELVNPGQESGAPGPRLILLEDIVRLVGSVSPGSKALLMVPAGAPLRVSLVTGTLELKGLAGRIDARVRDGALIASDWRGEGSLETASGELHVELAELTPGRAVKLRSYTGNITVRLPSAPTSGRVLAVSLAGRVQVPARFQLRGGRLYEAVFGAGDPVVSVDTVRGNVIVTMGER